MIVFIVSTAGLLCTLVVATIKKVSGRDDSDDQNTAALAESIKVYITTQCTTKNKTENSEPTYIKRLLNETIGGALLLDC